MHSITRVVIIGAGLGGLLAGALLSKDGFEVTILERMNFIGGRFTSFEKYGVPIPTGAVHMIPHRFGPMKTLLIDRLHLPVELIDAGRPAILDQSGEYIELGGGGAAKLFLKSIIGNKRANRIMDSIYEFSIGLRGNEIPLSERIAFMNLIRKYSHHVTPKGGVKSVIDALVETIQSHGGRIRLNHEVNAIDMVSDQFLVHAKGERLPADVVVANCSPDIIPDLLGETHRLLGMKFMKRVEDNHPVNGIKIAVVCSHQVFPRSIVFTPYLKIISGFSEPTVADPEMASGKHLILSHQKLRPGSIESQIKRAMEDFKSIITDFDTSCKTVAIQIFRGEYPVNRASQGADFEPITKIPGLYLVGDGVKPRGHIMTEGVAKSVEIAVDHITGGLAK